MKLTIKSNYQASEVKSSLLIRNSSRVPVHVGPNLKPRLLLGHNLCFTRGLASRSLFCAQVFSYAGFRWETMAPRFPSCIIKTNRQCELVFVLAPLKFIYIAAIFLG